ncbi:hypothetical protein F511_46881 [Dorcoceras hygrometricum]|uniref:Uncharacterized protein n=1 Tax=Dorcoceras hygrometricum TaxID=472368 RepID=A0A2Z6ZSE2_9LAMI|nr:hypothetical protein F511_46881 [Dorcoceras hygrometricum]
MAAQPVEADARTGCARVDDTCTLVALLHAIACRPRLAGSHTRGGARWRAGCQPLAHWLRMLLADGRATVRRAWRGIVRLPPRDFFRGGAAAGDRRSGETPAIS